MRRKPKVKKRKRYRNSRQWRFQKLNRQKTRMGQIMQYLIFAIIMLVWLLTP